MRPNRTDITRVLRYPLLGWGPLIWVVYALVLWMTALVGVLGGILLSLALVAYAVLVLRHAWQGNPELPGWADFVSLDAAVGRALRGAAVVLVAVLPLAFFLAALNRRGRWALFALVASFLVTALYLPMGLMIVSVREALSPALNPVLIFRSISRIPREYAVVVLVCAVLAMAESLLVLPFRTMPILGGAGSAIVASYLVFVQLSVLGHLARQCESKMDWRPAS